MQLDINSFLKKEKNLLDEACGILGMISEVKMKGIMLKRDTVNRKFSKKEVLKKIEILQCDLNTYRKDFDAKNKELENLYYEFDKISGLDNS